ncbi:MAG: hypothetical protein WB460_06005 [Candidatus Acidiferrales bacterium]
MPVKAFFDTDVLVYGVAGNDPRSAQAEELLASGGLLSVQILNHRNARGGTQNRGAARVQHL